MSVFALLVLAQVMPEGVTARCASDGGCLEGAQVMTPLMVAKKGGLEQCWLGAATRDDAVVTYVLVISPEGAVTEAKARHRSVSDGALACFSRELEKLEFPKAKGPTLAEVSLALTGTGERPEQAAASVDGFAVRWAGEGQCLDVELVKRTVQRAQASFVGCGKSGTSASVTLLVDRMGKVLKVTGEGGPCVEQRAKELTFPSSAGLTHASFVVRFE